MRSELACSWHKCEQGAASDPMIRNLLRRVPDQMTYTGAPGTEVGPVGQLIRHTSNRTSFYKQTFIAITELLVFNYVYFINWPICWHIMRMTLM